MALNILSAKCLEAPGGRGFLKVPERAMQPKVARDFWNMVVKAVVEVVVEVVVVVSASFLE